MSQGISGYGGFRTDATIRKDYSGFNGDGRDLEESVLYKVPWQVEYHRIGDLPRDRAISKVRANQPDGWDVTDPPTVAASNIQALACEAIGIEDFKDMRMYTALGSTLDKRHGSDAFLEFTDPETGDRQIVTLDVTRDPIKYIRGHKADIIVFGSHADVAARDIATLVEKRRVYHTTAV